MDILIGFIGGILAVLAFTWALVRAFGFSGQTPADYSSIGPDFDLRTRLNGPMVCEGVIFGPTGRVTSRFVADFDARWDGNSCVMSEKFYYDSGTTQVREWRLTLDENGGIRAEADDLEGVGSGTQSGSGVSLNYRIRLPESAGGHVLDVVDWMYLLENGAIMNRSQFRKFGVKVAELVATMRPRADGLERQDAA